MGAPSRGIFTRTRRGHLSRSRTVCGGILEESERTRGARHTERRTETRYNARKASRGINTAPKRSAPFTSDFNGITARAATPRTAAILRALRPSPPATVRTVGTYRTKSPRFFSPSALPFLKFFGFIYILCFSLLSLCFVAFASDKPSFRRFILAHPLPPPKVVRFKFHLHPDNQERKNSAHQTVFRVLAGCGGGI